MTKPKGRGAAWTEERATSDERRRRLKAPRRRAEDAASHFSTEALGLPAGPGRYVRVDAITPAEFLPGLTFRPVLGQRAMTNFVNYAPGEEFRGDRKSTRLNSSHQIISYAVFCLKKKNKTTSTSNESNNYGRFGQTQSPG